jgi:tRNA A58 N-methylase Trm61
MVQRLPVTGYSVRPWNVRGPSVRPAHFMVAHTVFIVVARRLRPGQTFVDDVYI